MVTIKELLWDCEHDARKQGFDGEVYNPTAQDLRWVCEQLGRKPTAQEWSAAGLAWVGSEHTAGG